MTVRTVLGCSKNDGATVINDNRRAPAMIQITIQECCVCFVYCSQVLLLKITNPPSSSLLFPSNKLHAVFRDRFVFTPVKRYLIQFQSVDKVMGGLGKTEDIRGRFFE